MILESILKRRSRSLIMLEKLKVEFWFIAKLAAQDLVIIAYLIKYYI